MATRPERRSRDQDRRRAARRRPVFPFGIGTKAINRNMLNTSSVPFISQPRFVHFTLNHYRWAVPTLRNRSQDPDVSAREGTTSRKADTWGEDAAIEPDSLRRHLAFPVLVALSTGAILKQRGR